MAEEYILRWNNFHNILSSGCHSFFENGDLADVTLSAEGSSVLAHKLILSVFSPYFRQIFKETPSNHPIVILKDVALHDLNALLQFMYKGEVSVNRRNIGSLMNTAALLEVKGLTVDREISEEREEQDSIKNEVSSLSENLESDEERLQMSRKRLLPNHNTPDKAKKRMKPDIQNNGDKIDLAEEHLPVIYNNGFTNMLNELSSPLKPDICNNISNNQEPTKETKETPDRNEHMKAIKCPSCPRMFVNRYNLKIHIRDKHIGNEGTLKCSICNKIMRNPSCLRVHMHKHKKEAAIANESLTNGSTVSI